MADLTALNTAVANLNASADAVVAKVQAQATTILNAPAETDQASIDAIAADVQTASDKLTAASAG